MNRKKKFRDDVPASVLIPAPLQRAIAARAVKEERSFSAVVRRAIKKDFGIPLDDDLASSAQTASNQ
jgi:hypothetical protein